VERKSLIHLKEVGWETIKSTPYSWLLTVSHSFEKHANMYVASSSAK